MSLALARRQRSWCWNLASAQLVLEFVPANEGTKKEPISETRVPGAVLPHGPRSSLSAVFACVRALRPRRPVVVGEIRCRRRSAPW
uniref:Putative secreted protein n=1 Tax=Ixodes ricinus TaxID=34613 RepID=A0A6B0UAZ5_IXORI